MKSAIRNGDVAGLRRLLAEDPARANELVVWGGARCIRTHPLHFISDMIFAGTLPPDSALPLVDALLAAGSDANFDRSAGEPPIIGAASLGAEDVGIRLLEAGARPERRGKFGETALHWAAMLGEHRLVERLIPGSDVNLRDARYQSPPLGWAVHGFCNTPAGSHGRHPEVAALLVAAGAAVDPDWLQNEQVRSHPAMLAALSGFR